MSDKKPCPVCRGPTRPTTIPVRIRRAGEDVFKLLVPARLCVRCEEVSIEDEVTDEVVAALEEHTEPGDDIVFPEGGPTLH